MTHENTQDFCTGESKEHCGCMRLSTCASLTEKIIINCEKPLHNANKGLGPHVQQLLLQLFDLLLEISILAPECLDLLGVLLAILKL